MLKMKRQIVKEEDRYGGYGLPVNLRSSRLLDNDEFATDRIATNSNIMVEDAPKDVVDSRIVVPQQEQKIEYSQSTTYPTTAQYVPQARKVLPRRDAEDLMPSIKSQAYANKDISEATKATPKQKVEVSGKSKAVLAIYAIIVIALATIVIATGIAIANVTSEVGLLENQIAMKNAVIIDQQNELINLSDKDTIKGEAEDNGMINVPGYKDLTLLPIVDKTQYSPKTNWFDSFCDWLSGIFAN